MLIHPSKMVASSSVSLTEELFQVTHLNQYRDNLQAIHLGDGISEKMFPTSAHGTKFELDNQLIIIIIIIIIYSRTSNNFEHVIESNSVCGVHFFSKRRKNLIGGKAMGHHSPSTLVVNLPVKLIVKLIEHVQQSVGYQ